MAELIKLMPNLKVLFFKCLIENDPNLRTFGIEIVPIEAQIDVDYQEVAGIEFPFLPYLIICQLWSSSRSFYEIRMLL